MLLVGLSTGLVVAQATLAQSAKALPVEGSPSSGCKELGEVSGTHFDASPQMDSAKANALKDARDLGATHVQVVPEKTHQSGAYEVTYTGIAYRCPG
jgi:hypothetical protein